MPYEIEKRGDTYRLVNPKTGKVAKTQNGTPRDGGGHESRSTAKAQRRAIMDSENDRDD